MLEHEPEGQVFTLSLHIPFIKLTRSKYVKRVNMKIMKIMKFSLSVALHGDDSEIEV